MAASIFFSVARKRGSALRERKSPVPGLGQTVGRSKRKIAMQEKLSALRLAVAGAFSLSVLFLLCWIGAMILPIGPSHMFVSLFTAAPADSVVALLVGGCAAFFTGAIGGALLAWSYNLTAGTRA